MDKKELLSKVIKNLEEIVASAAFSLMILTAVYNVITRYVFSSPRTWAEELECICLVWTTFPAAAACYKKNLHYGMDFLVDKLPMNSKLILRRCITFICIFLFAFLFVISFKFMLAATKTTAFFRLNYRYIDLAAVLAFASMSIYSIIYFIESFTNPTSYAQRYAVAYIDEYAAEERSAE